jgi:hypothetical protein
MTVTFITATFPAPNQLQLNALYSWGVAKIPVIVAGRLDDPAGIVAKFPNVQNVPEIRTASDMGVLSTAPLISDIIMKSLPFVKTKVVALINADILVKENFKEILEKIITKHGTNIFLSGQRYDIKNVSPVTSIEELRKRFDTSNLHQGQSGDIFIGSKERFEEFAKEMPDFFLGRMLWDNWIHQWFLTKNTSCFNTNPLLPTFHQEHGYGHISGDLMKDPAVLHNSKFVKYCRSIPNLQKWPPITL